MLFCSLVIAYECMAHTIHNIDNTYIYVIYLWFFYGRPIRPLFIRSVECCSCFLVMSPCISRCLLENRFVQPLLFSRPLLLAMGVANSVSHSSQKCDLLFSQWILPIFDYLRDWLCVFKFQMRDVLLVWAFNFCCQAVGESHNSRELNLCEQVAGRWRSVEAGSHTRTTGPGPSVVVYSVIGHGWFVPEPWAVIKDHTWQEVKQVGNDYMLVIMFDQWNHGLSSVV